MNNMHEFIDQLRAEIEKVSGDPDSIVLIEAVHERNGSLHVSIQFNTDLIRFNSE